MAGEVGLDSVGHEGECIATLLAAGFDDREHGLDKTTAGGALCAEGELSPDHGMTQRPLAGIVRRLDPFMPQKRPQPLAMLVQLLTHALHVRIPALSTPQHQTLHLAPDPLHSTQPCRRNVHNHSRCLYNS